MKRAKRIFSIVFLLLFILPFLRFPVHASAYKKESDLDSPYIAIYNTQNGRFVYTKEAQTHISPGSTTKIMTGILALEQFENNLDHIVTVPTAALRGLEGSTVIGLKAGEEIAIRDLLYAMLVAGANDAANVLAIASAGSILDFVSKMNQKAKELDALDTLYLNATGLDTASAYTTAADTARIAAYAMKNAHFMEMSSTRAYTVNATNKNEAITFYTRNAFLFAQGTDSYSKANGMSVGHTEKAGTCLVSAIDHGAHPYIGVAMGATRDPFGQTSAYQDLKNLLEWANSNFIDRKILDGAKIISELPVPAGRESDRVLIVPSKSVYAFLDKEADLSQIHLIPQMDVESLHAPVKKGTIVGSLMIVLDGDPIESVSLVTKNDVQKSSWRAVSLQISAFFEGKIFRSLVFILFILILIFIIGNTWMIFKKNKHQTHHNPPKNRQQYY